MAVETAADLAAFLSLAEFGVAVTSGAVSTTGILDLPAELVLGGQVVSSDYQLTYKTGDLPNLTHESAITVAGVAYKVRGTPRAQDDGALSIAFLSKV